MHCSLIYTTFAIAYGLICILTTPARLTSRTAECKRIIGVEYFFSLEVSDYFLKTYRLASDSNTNGAVTAKKQQLYITRLDASVSTPVK